MKLGKKLRRDSEKLRKNVGNTSQKLFKKHFDGKFVKFSGQFLEKLTKNCKEISKKFQRRIADEARRNLKSIWDALENLSREL